jgi:hypothetical protein
MKLKGLFFLFLSINMSFAVAQSSDSLNTFLGRIFLPSIDIGYQIPNSSIIEGSVRFATSIEYRIRNNNDFFVRLNYDTYGARYNLQDENATSNTIEGTAQMYDVSIAPGYRFGDDTYRLMISFMPGIRFYEFPSASITNQQILIGQESNYLFTTSALITLEYYFDQKSALTLSLFQNQVWKKVDFWADGGSAVGISIGFITSLL